MVQKGGVWDCHMEHSRNLLEDLCAAFSRPSPGPEPWSRQTRLFSWSSDSQWKQWCETVAESMGILGSDKCDEDTKTRQWGR